MQFLFCTLFALVFGGSWGAIIYPFSKPVGISVGLSLSCISFLLLINAVFGFGGVEEKRDRRFND